MKSIVKSRLDGKMVFEMAWVPFNGTKRGRIYCDYDMLLATQGVRVRELSEPNKTVANCGFVFGRLRIINGLEVERPLCPSVRDTWGFVGTGLSPRPPGQLFPLHLQFQLYSFVAIRGEKGKKLCLWLALVTRPLFGLAKKFSPDN